MLSDEASAWSITIRKVDKTRRSEPKSERDKISDATKTIRANRPESGEERERSPSSLLSRIRRSLVHSRAERFSRHSDKGFARGLFLIVRSLRKDGDDDSKQNTKNNTTLNKRRTVRDRLLEDMNKQRKFAKTWQLNSANWKHHDYVCNIAITLCQ